MAHPTRVIPPCLNDAKNPGPTCSPIEKDEKDQSEFLHEVPHFAVDSHPEMAEQDADEQYPCDTQRDASDFNFSQQNADGDYQRENKYGMGDAVAEKQGIQPLHINLILCLLSSRAQNYYISQK